MVLRAVDLRVDLRFLVAIFRIIARAQGKHKGDRGEHASLALTTCVRYDRIGNRLDRRQAVRHWVLVPAFAGSNPAGPATMK